MFNKPAGHDAPDRSSAGLSSFFVAGFECSTHRRRDRQRVDVLAGTGHDRLALSDYRQAAEHGLRVARDGLRWHLIETEPGVYDMSSWLPMLRAARAAGVQVIWDLWHYGSPDFIDIWSPQFVERFAAFAREAALVFKAESDQVPYWCPLNEMSFFSWIAGDHGDFYPYALQRAADLKQQLARAAVAASQALREVDPRCRLVWAEPAIHVAPRSQSSEDVESAARYHQAQYEVFDMIAGRMNPQLGGRPDYLDIVGLNYYPSNQWVDGEGVIPMGHQHYRPLSHIIGDAWRRYGRPLMISETGAEGSARAPWLHYVAHEVEVALDEGLPVQGICLYPVVEYPGWDDDRACPTGLFSAPDANGARGVHEPLARALYQAEERLELGHRPAPKRRANRRFWVV